MNILKQGFLFFLFLNVYVNATPQALSITGCSGTVPTTSAASPFNFLPISISVWFNTNQSPSGYYPIYGTYAASNGFELTQYFSIIKIWYGDGSVSWGPTPFGSISVASNTWYHVVWTYDSSHNLKLYSNGAVDGSYSTAAAGVPTVSSGFSIGGSANAAGLWVGLIDELAIYNSILSSSDATTLYHSPASALTSNLVSYYSFDNDGATSLVDSVGSQTITGVGTCAQTHTTSISTNIAPISGDPKIRSFDGEVFEFHGVPESIFNVISTKFFQFNSKFSFISHGRNNHQVKQKSKHLHLPHTESWTHPGTYLTRMGLKFKLSDESNDLNNCKELKILLNPGSYEHGLKAYSSFNDCSNKEMNFTDSIVHIVPDKKENKYTYKNWWVTINHETPYMISIFSGYKKDEYIHLTIVNSDHFFNVHSVEINKCGLVSCSNNSLSNSKVIVDNELINGFLGHTLSNLKKICLNNNKEKDENNNKCKYPLIDPLDIKLSSKDIFSDEFIGNRYGY